MAVRLVGWLAGFLVYMLAGCLLSCLISESVSCAMSMTSNSLLYSSMFHETSETGEVPLKWVSVLSLHSAGRLCQRGTKTTKAKDKNTQTAVKLSYADYKPEIQIVVPVRKHSLLYLFPFLFLPCLTQPTSPPRHPHPSTSRPHHPLFFRQILREAGMGAYSSSALL